MIETITKEAIGDPGKAMRLGIAPMRRTPLFEASSGGPPSHADWLRGAVIALLGAHWRYEIFEGIDGTGLLVLLGCDDAG